MGLIPEHIIGEIRDRADIVAVIGQHVKLRKTGQSHKGLCPFHNEKSPSFNVNGEKGFFYCFGCHKKGDVFSFVMELEGKSFVEAAESLADRFGVQIPEQAVPGSRQRSRRTELLQITALARDFFRSQLASTRGRGARAYLESRGIAAATAEAFGLGYAPAEWGALAEALAARAQPLALAEAAGLVIPRKSGRGYYDRFRDRLMCPIADASGACVGFSGRRLGDGEDAGAKYINSPENAIYKKSRLLFGLDLARAGFRERGRAILVEGNFDVVSLHQVGLTETVAPLGTALTDSQATKLHRLVGQVVLLYDGDQAGRTATLRSLETLLGADLEVRIATLPKGSDPDDLARMGGFDAVVELVDRAQPGVEYFIDTVWREAGSSAHGRARAIDEAARVLKSVANPAKRDLLIGELAAMLVTDTDTVRTNLRRSLRRQMRPDEAPTRVDPDEIKREIAPERRARTTDPPPPLELDIVALLADHPRLVQKAEQLGVFSLLTDPRLRDMYSAACAGQPMLSASEDTTPEIAKRVLEGMYAAVDSPDHSLDEVVGRLRHSRQRARLAELQQRAELARRSGDSDTVRTLVSEILTIRKQVD